MMSIDDYIASGGQYGHRYGDVGYLDGVDELLGETEDVFGDIGKFLAPVGNILTAPLTAIGQVASGHADQALGTLLDPAGVFKTGPNAGPIGSIIGGSGGPGGLLGGIGQGISQALGMGGAPTPGGSIVGAGLGGIIPGTGALPGILGQLATQLTGSPALPPVGTVMPSPALATLQDHTEKVGRAVVRRILGITTPALNTVRSLLAQRRNQVQATAEHNQITSANAFQNEVLGHLQTIASNNGRVPWKRY